MNMIAHVILRFDDVQAYQQTINNLYDCLPLLTDWEEVAVFEEE